MPHKHVFDDGVEVTLDDDVDSGDFFDADADDMEPDLYEALVKKAEESVDTSDLDEDAEAPEPAEDGDLG